MAVQVTTPIDDVTFERARTAVSARSQTIVAAVPGTISGIIGLVEDHRPTHAPNTASS